MHSPYMHMFKGIKICSVPTLKIVNLASLRFEKTMASHIIKIGPNRAQKPRKNTVIERFGKRYGSVEKLMEPMIIYIK